MEISSGKDPNNVTIKDPTLKYLGLSCPVLGRFSHVGRDITHPYMLRFHMFMAKANGVTHGDDELPKILPYKYTVTSEFEDKLAYFRDHCTKR